MYFSFKRDSQENNWRNFKLLVTIIIVTNDSFMNIIIPHSNHDNIEDADDNDDDDDDNLSPLEKWEIVNLGTECVIVVKLERQLLVRCQENGIESPRCNKTRNFRRASMRPPSETITRRARRDIKLRPPVTCALPTGFLIN